jgi:hypothetical protein
MWVITCFVSILILWVPLVEQEQRTLPKHLSSSTVFSGVRITLDNVRSLHVSLNCLLLIASSVFSNVYYWQLAATLNEKYIACSGVWWPSTRQRFNYSALGRCHLPWWHLLWHCLVVTISTWNITKSCSLWLIWLLLQNESLWIMLYELLYMFSLWSRLVASPWSVLLSGYSGFFHH